MLGGDPLGVDRHDRRRDGTSVRKEHRARRRRAAVAASRRRVGSGAAREAGTDALDTGDREAVVGRASRDRHDGTAVELRREGARVDVRQDDRLRRRVGVDAGTNVPRPGDVVVDTVGRAAGEREPTPRRGSERRRAGGVRERRASRSKNRHRDRRRVLRIDSADRRRDARDRDRRRERAWRGSGRGEVDVERRGRNVDARHDLARAGDGAAHGRAGREGRLVAGDRRAVADRHRVTGSTRDSERDRRAGRNALLRVRDKVAVVVVVLETVRVGIGRRSREERRDRRRDRASGAGGRQREGRRLDKVDGERVVRQRVVLVCELASKRQVEGVGRRGGDGLELARRDVLVARLRGSSVVTGREAGASVVVGVARPDVGRAVGSHRRRTDKVVVGTNVIIVVEARATDRRVGREPHLKIGGRAGTADGLVDVRVSGRNRHRQLANAHVHRAHHASRAGSGDGPRVRLVLVAVDDKVGDGRGRRRLTVGDSQRGRGQVGRGGTRVGLRQRREERHVAGGVGDEGSRNVGDRDRVEGGEQREGDRHRVTVLADESIGTGGRVDDSREVETLARKDTVDRHVVGTLDLARIASPVEGAGRRLRATRVGAAAARGRSGSRDPRVHGALHNVRETDLETTVAAGSDARRRDLVELDIVRVLEVLAAPERNGGRGSSSREGSAAVEGRLEVVQQMTRDRELVAGRTDQLVGGRDRGDDSELRSPVKEGLLKGARCKDKVAVDEVVLQEVVVASERQRDVGRQDRRAMEGREVVVTALQLARLHDEVARLAVADETAESARLAQTDRAENVRVALGLATGERTKVEPEGGTAVLVVVEVHREAHSRVGAGGDRVLEVDVGAVDQRVGDAQVGARERVHGIDDADRAHGHLERELDADRGLGGDLRLRMESTDGRVPGLREIEEAAARPLVARKHVVARERAREHQAGGVGAQRVGVGVGARLEHELAVRVLLVERHADVVDKDIGLRRSALAVGNVVVRVGAALLEVGSTRGTGAADAERSRLRVGDRGTRAERDGLDTAVEELDRRLEHHTASTDVELGVRANEAVGTGIRVGRVLHAHDQLVGGLARRHGREVDDVEGVGRGGERVRGTGEVERQRRGNEAVRLSEGRVARGGDRVGHECRRAGGGDEAVDGRNRKAGRRRVKVADVGVRRTGVHLHSDVDRRARSASAHVHRERDLVRGTGVADRVRQVAVLSVREARAVAGRRTAVDVCDGVARALEVVDVHDDAAHRLLAARRREHDRELLRVLAVVGVCQVGLADRERKRVAHHDRERVLDLAAVGLIGVLVVGVRAGGRSAVQVVDQRAGLRLGHDGRVGADDRAVVVDAAHREVVGASLELTDTNALVTANLRLGLRRVETVRRVEGARQELEAARVVVPRATEVLERGLAARRALAERREARRAQTGLGVEVPEERGLVVLVARKDLGDHLRVGRHGGGRDGDRVVVVVELAQRVREHRRHVERPHDRRHGHRVDLDVDAVLDDELARKRQVADLLLNARADDGRDPVGREARAPVGVARRNQDDARAELVVRASLLSERVGEV